MALLFLTAILFYIGYFLIDRYEDKIIYKTNFAYPGLPTRGGFSIPWSMIYVIVVGIVWTMMLMWLT